MAYLVPLDLILDEVCCVARQRVLELVGDDQPACCRAVEAILLRERLVELGETACSECLVVEVWRWIVEVGDWHRGGVLKGWRRRGGGCEQRERERERAVAAEPRRLRSFQCQ